MMRLVILPQAIRRMMPPFINQSIIQLKNTSLVSTIAVPDLLYQGPLSPPIPIGRWKSIPWWR